MTIDIFCDIIFDIQTYKFLILNYFMSIKKSAGEEIREYLKDPEVKAYMKKRQAEIDLSVKIKMHRERLGFSQRELAEKMGVPQPTITRMESGESGISSTTLEKFCEVTGLEIEFVPDTKEKNVIEVAEYVLLRCYEILGEKYDLTILKLNKLLFYIQVKYLVDYKQPFFSHQIEAWDYGPVHPQVWSQYTNPKEPKQLLLPTANSFTLNKSEKNLIDYILFGYDEGLAHKSAYQLVEKTHQENPWINAHRKGNNTIISTDEIIKYYKNRI